MNAAAKNERRLRLNAIKRANQQAGLTTAGLDDNWATTVASSCGGGGGSAILNSLRRQGGAMIYRGSDTRRKLFMEAS